MKTHPIRSIFPPDTDVTSIATELETSLTTTDDRWIPLDPDGPLILRDMAPAMSLLDPAATAPERTAAVITRPILVLLALRGAGFQLGRQLSTQGTASPTLAVALLISAMLRSEVAR